MSRNISPRTVSASCGLAYHMYNNDFMFGNDSEVKSMKYIYDNCT